LLSRISLAVALGVAIAPTSALAQSLTFSSDPLLPPNVAFDLPADVTGLLLVNTTQDAWERLSQYPMVPPGAVIPPLVPFLPANRPFSEIQPWIGGTHVATVLLPSDDPAAAQPLTVIPVGKPAGRDAYLDLLRQELSKQTLSEREYAGVQILEWAPYDACEVVPDTDPSYDLFCPPPSQEMPSPIDEELLREQFPGDETPEALPEDSEILEEETPEAAPENFEPLDEETPEEALEEPMDPEAESESPQEEPVSPDEIAPEEPAAQAAMKSVKASEAETQRLAQAETPSEEMPLNPDLPEEWQGPGFGLPILPDESLPPLPADFAPTLPPRVEPPAPEVPTSVIPPLPAGRSVVFPESMTPAPEYPLPSLPPISEPRAVPAPQVPMPVLPRIPPFLDDRPVVLPQSTTPVPTISPLPASRPSQSTPPAPELSLPATAVPAPNPASAPMPEPIPSALPDPAGESEEFLPPLPGEEGFIPGPLDENSPWQFPLRRPGIAIAVLPGYLVYSSDSGAVERFIDAYQGSGQRLVQDARFQRTLVKPQFSQALMVGYGSLQGLADLAIANAPPPAASVPDVPFLSPDFAQSTLQRLLEPYDTVDFTVWPQTEGMRVQSSFYYDAAMPERIVPVGRAESALLGRLPASTYMATTGVDFRQQWNDTLAFFEADPGTQVIVEGLRGILKSGTGLDLDEDVVGWMDGEFGTFLYPSRQGLLTQIDPKLQVGIGVMFQTSDRARAESTFQKIDELIAKQFGSTVNVVQESVDNTPVTLWKVPGPDGAPTSLAARGWLSNDVLAFTSGIEDFSLLAKPYGQPLNEFYTFRQATDLLPDPNHGYFYMNAGSTLSMIYNLLLPGPLAGRELRNFLSPLQSVSGSFTVFPEGEQLDGFLSIAPNRPRVINAPLGTEDN